MTTISSMRALGLALLVLVSIHVQAHSAAQLNAVTDDGRQVKLLVDHTWTFVEVEKGLPENSAVLTVTKVQEMQDACKLSFHMHNNLGFKIRTLVPRFGVYNKDGILFDTKSLGFSSIKPTKDLYKTLQFSGIGCHEITRIRVYDAARCLMGNIDQWNEEEGQCLSHIYVTPSEIINIAK